jgi:predicted anti-sigma-YlaC factor YlaD
MRCEEFLKGYSSYLDNVLTGEQVDAYAEHIRECRACRRYDRVVKRGQQLCQVLPPVESSPDFIPRLKHRLYHIDDASRLASRHIGSAALVAVASVGFLALAWLPFATRMTVEVELPAIAVSTPAPSATDSESVPALFRSGPFVESAANWGPTVPMVSDSDDFFDLLFMSESATGAEATRINVAASPTR